MSAPTVKSKPAEDALINAKEGAALRKQIVALETALKQTIARQPRVSLELSVPSNTLAFGVIGDTHDGSRYEANSELHAMYEKFRAAGVKDVLHAGDVLDGHDVYKGQQFELHSHGFESQLEWFRGHAPRVPGITTHFITGNHDASFKKAAGIGVGRSIASVRPDHHFIGEDYATIDFRTPNGRRFRVGLMHPSGGSAYSLSYRPQKIVETLEGGTKPHLLCIGHYHKAEFMPSYRNVAVLQSATFQRQTPFMVTKGLAAHVGGWIIRVTVHPRSALSNTINAEFTAFYRERS
ncbi:MAG: metallophosphoesterase family protein [Gemmatimonadaceae bacterium]|jgi:predicted phosphodiesterase